MANFSSNGGRGVDFILNTLGVHDRANWDVVSCNDRTYRTEIITVRPDFVLHNRAADVYVVLDYKNRHLGRGEVSLYERYQMVIYTVTVRWDLQCRLGRQVKVTNALLYGDRQLRTVDCEPEDEDQVCFAAFEAPTALYFQGITEKYKETVAGTDLARFMADPALANTRYKISKIPVLDPRAAGIKAHDLLSRSWDLH